jgi:Cu-Zn family superoxide dismutase
MRRALLVLTHSAFLHNVSFLSYCYSNFENFILGLMYNLNYFLKFKYIHWNRWSVDMSKLSNKLFEMSKIKLLTGGLISAVAISGCTSMTKTDEMHKIRVHAVTAEGVEGSLGTVTFIKADQGGLVVKPDLQGLPPGKHGYPQGEGHLGDLPAITVNADGTATSAVQAPRLSLDAIQGRALMIHAGGDNYSDTPEALGGGGARIACGVIE